MANKYAGNRKIKGKSQITPNKKVLMQMLLNERVASEGCDVELVIERCDRLNRLLGDGLYTITKRQVAKKIQKSHQL